MAATAYHLEDIYDTSDPKSNERLNVVKRLLHVVLEQQAESSASRRCATLSRASQTMDIADRGCSNTHAHR
jgi:hypothetical protein